MIKTLAKLLLAHLQCFDLFPSTGVKQYRIGQRKPQRQLLQYFDEVLPHHVSETEEDRPLVAGSREILLQPVDIERHVIAQSVKGLPAERQHPENTGSSGGRRPAVAHHARVIEKHHWPAFDTKKVLHDLHECS